MSAHVSEKPVARPVRLTARGRLVVLLGLIALLIVAFSLGRVGTQASQDRGHEQALSQTVVRSGESLWAVAKRVAPGHDPRAVVDQIAELNDLSSSSLQPGQLLLVPAS
jgi:hypothetical protein